MPIATRAVEDLIRIARAGGGFRLNASTLSADDLVRIARASGQGHARIFMLGLSARSTDELVRIGAAGEGNVVFED